VQTRQRAEDPAAVIAGGDAILCTAASSPRRAGDRSGATEEFRQQLSKKPSLWRTTPVPGPAATVFNVKKEGGTEPDLWVRLYRLEL